MPLHPDCLKVHALYAAAKRPPLEQQTPAEAREAMQRGRVFTQPDAPEVGAIEQLSALGPHGPIALRLYRPKTPATSGPLGALVFYHGGGWVIGDLDSHDVLCRELANHSGHIVVAVDYRLGPEHRFPAAYDDALAATQNIIARAGDLGIDATRMAVGGDSAGGNLAAAVAIALQGKLASELKLQLLIYPAVDARMQRPSVERCGDVLPLTKAAMQWFYKHYTGGADVAGDWRLSPLLAKSHAGLPPAFVLTAEYDVLVDEGHAYADTLTAAGVAVERKFYPGMIHGFITMDKMVADANVAMRHCAAALRRALA
jgi:acetyl esterase